MDCGDVPSVRAIHLTEPNGRFDTARNARVVAASGAVGQRATSVQNPADDLSNASSIEPFGVGGGGVIAPPVHVPEFNMAIAWDSINGGLAGVNTSGVEMEVVWHLDVRASMQPVVFPESGELVINDFTADGRDDLVVVDVASGALIDRVDAGSRIANGMFLTAGGNRMSTTATRWLESRGADLISTRENVHF